MKEVQCNSLETRYSLVGGKHVWLVLTIGRWGAGGAGGFGENGWSWGGVEEWLSLANLIILRSTSLIEIFKLVHQYMDVISVDCPSIELVDRSHSPPLSGVLSKLSE